MADDSPPVVPPYTPWLDAAGLRRLPLHALLEGVEEPVGVKITVYATPAPQGSKRGFVTKAGRVALVESSKAVKPWRESVAQAIMLAHPFGGRPDPILCRGPVRVSIMFVLRRPKSAKNGAYPATRPDIDKLTRSTLDALTQMGVFADDGRVVDLNCSKRYPGQDNTMAVPGAVISVESL